MFNLVKKSALNTLSKRLPLLPKKPQPLLKASLAGPLAIGVGGVLFGLYFFDARSAIHEYLVCPAIRLTTSAEDGHKLGIFCLKYGLSPRLYKDIDDEVLKVSVFGKELSNPVGIAAGLDKDGEAMDGLYNTGFSYVEIGSITPEPQPGNPKPRFFRIPKDESVINRYGFNSSGHWNVLARLRKRFDSFVKDYQKSGQTPPNNAFRPGKLLGINLGKNKTGDEVEDYVKGIQRLGPYADVLVINVSSPNTPGLRDLQAGSKLTSLLERVVSERDKVNSALDNKSKASVLVKIAPDLTEEEIKDIATSAKKARIDGIVVSNTTISRPTTYVSPNDPILQESGGLSGRPLKPLSLKVLRCLRKYTKDSNLALVGCGGIASGKDAIDFAKAGATFVELYTAFAYRGPSLPYKIKQEITQELKREGKTWMQIVGEDDP
ncbi:Dihydroorotate dehydrogenase (quinone), mitochondrial [Komagataella kurtzmanii]|nr:Dihydroorotate dehydrogenase (quinone), mitochondrial [Komagataella kurtzmanii]